MEKNRILAVLFGIVLLAGCMQAKEEFCASSEGKLSLNEAKQIAQASECGQNGVLKDTKICNENSGTWWIDLEVRDDAWSDPTLKNICNPACVINVANKQAEINWRCTGARPPA